MMRRQTNPKSQWLKIKISHLGRLHVHYGQQGDGSSHFSYSGTQADRVVTISNAVSYYARSEK